MKTMTPWPPCRTSVAQWMLLGVVALVAGCAGYAPTGIRPGATVDEVVQVMGAPTGQYGKVEGAPPAATKRLEFARGPFGKHTYMLDFDAGGRLLGWKQVLVEEEFNKVVKPGMTQQQLLEVLGHPSDIRRIAYQRQTVWSYRYESPFCQWFEVGLLPTGLVADTSYGPDPLCERRERFP